MSELWAVALPILAIDVANPVLLAAVILAATTSSPYSNGLAVIAGHTLAYFAVGVFSYHKIFEKYSFVDALYYTCVCFSTVG